jgi:small multidrug resistance pump
MKYLFLALAIITEVIGSSFLNASNQFTKLIPSSITVVAYLACFYFLSLALKSIPLGVAYAIWGGLGIVLTAIISVIVFKQKMDLPTIFGIEVV